MNKLHMAQFHGPNVSLYVFLSAICLPGCDEEHGFCEKPGECKYVYQLFHTKFNQSVDSVQFCNMQNFFK